ncbi:MAG: chemotaxis-specific protein-glutamate methyltransferase CheB [Oscillospiraceae bacterium]|nr:chemotaxis-specific protein-glutamate methyltransferase CheB [Oscillospiraceae bacterium]
MPVHKIRILIVEDSLFFREFLTRLLSNDPYLEIAGSFSDPVEAQKHLDRLKPDVMIVDMEMPRMRGNEFLRTVLPRYPQIKAIVVSALSNNVFDAMQAGAVDFVSKPNTRPGYDNNMFLREVAQKVRAAAAATSKAARPHMGAMSQIASMPGPSLSNAANLSGATSRSLVAIGASTGGTEAIVEVVKKFPAGMPGVVIVQHMPPVFTKMFAERVDKISKMNVREAANGDRLERGVVLIAPGGDLQLRVRSDTRGYYVALSAGPKVSGHCPSVDVLFDSVADAAGRDAVGIILTGMGADGAKGLLKMRQKGAHTIGQDQASCVVYGMPMVAYNIGGVAQQVPLSAVSDAAIRRFVR